VSSSTRTSSLLRGNPDGNWLRSLNSSRSRLRLRILLGSATTAAGVGAPQTHYIYPSNLAPERKSALMRRHVLFCKPPKYTQLLTGSMAK
jgi:hypothetical protein